MRTYTIQDIRALNPCYNPSEKLPEDWTGTSVDVLRLDRVLPEDRLWVVSHWIDDRTLRLFAVWCAREALELANDPDSRSASACDVADSAADAAYYAAHYAAQYTADSAADAAAWATAKAATWSAADATWASAWAAAWADAWAYAWVAAWATQINHLITMIEEQE